MKALLYRTKCLTNMHVGSGDVAYTIIDNEIEKDAVLNNVAVIHPSGVKGAVKYFFANQRIDSNIIDYIFGNEVETGEVEREKKQKKTVPGKYKFMGATLMARPLRVSDGRVSYVLAVSEELINYQLELFRALGISHIDGIDITNMRVPTPKCPVMVSSTYEFKAVEGIETKPYEDEKTRVLLEKLIGPSFAVLENKFWKEQEYPMIARNCLNDQGISENLWYEEIVPHESIFYFPVLADNNYIDEFKNTMENIIQFGANASLGYGLAKVSCFAENGGDFYG